MEDAATAEISRAQIWQWLKHSTTTVEGRKITLNYFNELLKEELDNIKNIVGEKNYREGKFKEASDIFISISTSDKFEEFLTLPSYKLI